MNDKQYFQKQLLNIIEPIKKYYRGGKVFFARHSAWYDDGAAETEAFARPLWGLVPYLAGGGRHDEFVRLYLDGIREGADRESDTYWGIAGERDQRYVEMASIAYAMLFTPDTLWQPLSDKTKDDLTAWLWQINTHDVCDSNWRFFRVLVNIALKKAGREYSAEKLNEDLTRLDEFYVSDGWYRDGVHGQADYYIAFAFHFYGLIYAAVMDRDDPERARLYRSRAEMFAKTFIYWFDDDGEALPYGRSLTYRFAQCALWSACVIADVRPFPIEVMKGIIERNLSKWLGKSIFDCAGILTVGYDYPNLNMAEHYNAHGSPYWGLKAYAFLMLPDDHEFWTCESAPMPKLDEKILIKPADMLISRRNGKTVAYPTGDNEYFDCGQTIPKYLKFAYSAHFGFNVMLSPVNLAEAAPDNMLVFDADGLILFRRHFISADVTEENVTIKWSPFKGIDVVTVVTPTHEGHIREHEITSEYDCDAYDAGFAVTEEGQCAVYGDGGENVIIPASPNTNLRFRKTVIPAVKYHIPKGVTKIKTVIKDGLDG